jgi:hypothetical protein
MQRIEHYRAEIEGVEIKPTAERETEYSREATFVPLVGVFLFTARSSMCPAP